MHVFKHPPTMRACACVFVGECRIMEHRRTSTRTAPRTQQSACCEQWFLIFVRTHSIFISGVFDSDFGKLLGPTFFLFFSRPEMPRAFSQGGIFQTITQPQTAYSRRAHTAASALSRRELTAAARIQPQSDHNRRATTCVVNTLWKRSACPQAGRSDASPWNHGCCILCGSTARARAHQTAGAEPELIHELSTRSARAQREHSTSTA